MCNTNVEDEMHLFMDCVFVVNYWKEVNLWEKIQQHGNVSGSFSSIIFNILRDLDEDTLARFVSILWRIWRSHNS